MPAVCKHNRNADWCEACTIEYQSKQLKRYEKALKEIIAVGEKDTNFPQDGRMYDIAKAALAP